MVCGGKAVIAVEVIAGTLNILMCGGGHVAAALANQCSELGYAYTVADGREELATRERFPGAGELIVTSPADYIATTELSRYSHIIIFTHDHGLDLESLKAVAKSAYNGYIGLIGSAKKWARFRKELLEEGVTKDWLDGIHCPIGLAINAHTPAEIGLSIAAEIVREKNR